MAVVDGDEEARAEKEVDVVRPEASLARMEVDAVEDGVEVSVLSFDLRVVEGSHRILH